MHIRHNHKSGQSLRRCSGQALRQRSGQAMIFLMVVVVVGLFVVIWNFDLHRVITAKIRTRNAADAAALAGARWQGVTLNMIGDLNLIQAAILTEEFVNNPSVPFDIPMDARELHDLRSRLAFIGPLAAYSIAQQAAFQNGAMRDPRVEANLIWLASEFRARQGEGSQPYDNAYRDYAELLESIAAQGAAVSSYAYQFPDHPLTQERFYWAIAQAQAGWWCPMDDYEYELEHYVTYEDWSTLRLELSMFYMMGLKLGEYASVFAYQPLPNQPPGIAIPERGDFRRELHEYFNLDERGVFSAGGYPQFGVSAMYFTPATDDVLWHVFGGPWSGRWPQPTTGKNDFEEDDEDMDRFPLRNEIRPEFNYMGAESGVSIAQPALRGIVASADRETVELVHRAKAKPFGYVDAAGLRQPPYYFGFVFPVFEEVRLVHSDIGDTLVDGDFFRHVFSHVLLYLDAGSGVLPEDCRYCQLLRGWETLDRDEGLRWLENADKAGDDNPCDPEDTEFWDDARGGATGGS